MAGYLSLVIKKYIIIRTGGRFKYYCWLYDYYCEYSPLKETTQVKDISVGVNQYE